MSIKRIKDTDRNVVIDIHSNITGHRDQDYVGTSLIEVDVIKRSLLDSVHSARQITRQTVGGILSTLVGKIDAVLAADGYNDVRTKMDELYNEVRNAGNITFSEGSRSVTAVKNPQMKYDMYDTTLAALRLLWHMTLTALGLSMNPVFLTLQVNRNEAGNQVKLANGVLFPTTTGITPTIHLTPSISWLSLKKVRLPMVIANIGKGRKATWLSTAIAQAQSAADITIDTQTMIPAVYGGLLKQGDRGKILFKWFLIHEMSHFWSGTGDSLHGLDDIYLIPSVASGRVQFRKSQGYKTYLQRVHTSPKKEGNLPTPADVVTAAFHAASINGSVTWPWVL